MKRLLHPALEISRLEMPRLGLPAFRLRILVRSVFVLLALATVALSVVVLKDEKERAWQAYQHGFVRSQAEVMARLRHPSGQLALLNASHLGQGVTPLAPLLLPYAALDVDEQNKVRNAVDMAGCEAGGATFVVARLPGGDASQAEARLAACVNILSPCHSVYRWKGVVECADEVPMLIKTTEARYAALEELVRARHPYETPELVALPVTHGLHDYLAWVAAETTPDSWPNP